MPDNPAFSFDSEGFIRRNPGYAWEKGFFQPLEMDFESRKIHPLHVYHWHPVLGIVEIECDFPLGRLPIWGNAKTFSFEPYYVTSLLPGAATRWHIRYQF